MRLSVMNSEMPLICAKKSGHQGLNADFLEICPYHTIFRICVLRASFATSDLHRFNARGLKARPGPEGSL